MTSARDRRTAKSTPSLKVSQSKGSEFYSFRSLLAPKNFSLEFINSTAVMVNIEGVEGNPDVVLYKAMAGCGHSARVCRVIRETKPLRCQLVKLTPEVPYTITVRSCLLGDVCGEPLKTKLQVKPKRKRSSDGMIKN